MSRSSTAAAERQRRHRRLSDQGRACTLADYDADAFHACEVAGLLNGVDRDDRAAMRTAVRRAMSALIAKAARDILQEDFLSRVTTERVRLAYEPSKNR